MAALTVQNSVLGGVQKATLVAATTDGDTAVNDGKTFLEIDNAAVSAITVTIAGQQSLPLSTSADKVISIPATSIKLIGPFPVGNYNRETDESIVITYSAVLTVTVGAFTVNDDYN